MRWPAAGWPSESDASAPISVRSASLAGATVIALAVALTFNAADPVQRAIPDYTASLNRAAAVSGGTVDKALGSKRNTAVGHAVSNNRPPPFRTAGQCRRSPGSTPGSIPSDGAAVSPDSLTGKVVLVDFWAYSCINCQRAIPHDEAWYAAYQAAGLEVIGVHTPEYAFEHVQSNVAAGAKRLGITYPVALDNEYTTWNNFDNDSWPAEYLIDATGEVRHVAIGEGDYATTESLIRKLLRAARPNVALPPKTRVTDTTPMSVLPDSRDLPGRRARATRSRVGRSPSANAPTHTPITCPATSSPSRAPGWPATSR